MTCPKLKSSLEVFRFKNPGKLGRNLLVSCRNFVIWKGYLWMFPWEFLSFVAFDFM